MLLLLSLFPALSVETRSLETSRPPVSARFGDDGCFALLLAV
jgi:hypothetical protein